MLWIKRNIFLVVGGLLAVVLLGFGSYYLLTSIKRNKDVEGELEDKKETLERLYKQDPFPNTTNISAAKHAAEKVTTIVKQTQQSFTPIPSEKVTGLAFKTLLNNTIYELHKMASLASVALPSKTYSFSFQAQRDALNISAASFPALPERLAEVKTICALLFDAKINALVSLQRERVSLDDPAGSPDYHELVTKTNDISGAVSSPYQLTFHCFSSDLATAMENFYKTPHGLVIKAVEVDIAPALVGDAGGGAAPPPFAPPGSRYEDKGFPRVAPGLPDRYRLAPPGAPGARPGPATPGALQTVLNERQLKITILLEVIKSLK